MKRRIAKDIEEFAALGSLYSEFLEANPHIHPGTAISALLVLLFEGKEHEPSGNSLNSLGQSDLP